MGAYGGQKPRYPSVNPKTACQWMFIPEHNMYIYIYIIYIYILYYIYIYVYILIIIGRDGKLDHLDRNLGSQ